MCSFAYLPFSSFRYLRTQRKVPPMRAALLLLSLIAAVPVLADETIRCGSHIVTSAMSVAEIVDKCGEPASKQAREEEVRARTPDGASVVVGTTVIEEWTYDRGRRAAPVRITIVDGKVRSIERIL
jgi:hypothetical protein